MPQQSLAEIGRYRPATRIREGWHVRTLPTEGDGPAEWHAIVRVLRVVSPVSFVHITLADGTTWAGPPDADVFCRTTTEIARTTTEETPR